MLIFAGYAMPIFGTARNILYLCIVNEKRRVAMRETTYRPRRNDVTLKNNSQLRIEKRLLKRDASGAAVYVSANGCLHVHTTIDLDNLTADVA